MKEPVTIWTATEAGVARFCEEATFTELLRAYLSYGISSQDPRYLAMSAELDRRFPNPKTGETA